MSAPVALRPGRLLALVQRPRRRMHFASIGTGEQAWLTVCDREVVAEGASFWHHDARTIADEQADEMCVHCYRVLLMATFLADRDLASVPQLRAAR